MLSFELRFHDEEEAARANRHVCDELAGSEAFVEGDLFVSSIEEYEDGWRFYFAAGPDDVPRVGFVLNLGVWDERRWHELYA